MNLQMKYELGVIKTRIHIFKRLHQTDPSYLKLGTKLEPIHKILYYHGITPMMQLLMGAKHMLR